MHRLVGRAPQLAATASLLVGLVAGGTACGAATQSATSAAHLLRSSSPRPNGSPSATTAVSVSSQASTITPPSLAAPRLLNGGLGILAVATAAQLSPDGSASAPRDVFRADTDRRVIVVLTLSHLPAGTKISFVRWLDGKFVDTKTATLRRAAAHVYFEFTAVPGKTLTVGSYRVRLYVNGTAAAETMYRVV